MHLKEYPVLNPIIMCYQTVVSNGILALLALRPDNAYNCVHTYCMAAFVCIYIFLHTYILM